MVMLRFKKHPILIPPTPEEISRMKPEKLAELHEIYHSAIANSEEDPYRYGFHLKNWSDADELLGTFNEVLVSGGNRCVCGETTYVYNPDTELGVKMKDVWAGSIKLSAWGGKTPGSVYSTV